MRAQLDELQEELIFVHQVDVNAGVGSNLNVVVAVRPFAVFLMESDVSG